MYGYGNTLRVNLTDATIHHHPTEEHLAQAYLGGRGLNVKRLWDELPAHTDGLSPENILVFGLPGTGKTHLVAALGYEWIQSSYSVLFIPTFKLVGGLLRSKRDYELEPELRRLDRFQVVILDDLGYVQQSREEMEVLFTFLAERYERRSLVITSNLVFSQWDRIFKDPLTTAAAIDRVVHHSLIIEFSRDMKSVRAEEAARRKRISFGGAHAAQDAEK